MASLDSEGTTEPMQVFPGPWSVYVVDRKNGWSHRHPDFAYVVAGQGLEVHVAVQVVEGIITIIDEEKAEPLANRTFSLRVVREATYSGPSVSGTVRQTDSAGRLTLSLVPDTYRLEDDSRSVDLIWTVTGPSVAEVDL